jgi:hypothetical protein
MRNRRLHIENLRDLCSSPNSLQIIKQKMRRLGHESLLGGKRDSYTFSVGKSKEVDHLGNLRIDERFSTKSDLQERV